MYYVFEDEETQGISQLILTAYKDEARAKIKFSSGRGNLLRLAGKLIRETGDSVCAFVDLVPDGKDTVDSFRKLLCFEAENRDKFIVIPIICIEYYLIKSIANSDVSLDSEEISRCLSICNYTESRLVHNNWTGTFEKYCKKVVDSAFKRCLRHRDKILNTKVNCYYTRCDCPCNIGYQSDGCTTISRLHKAFKLLSMLYVIPIGTVFSEDTKIPVHLHEAYSLRKKFVDEHSIDQGG